MASSKTKARQGSTRRTRSLVIGSLAIAMAAVGSATAQDPAPPCDPGVQLAPGRLAFSDEGHNQTTSATVGHSADLDVSVYESGPWTVDGMTITGPPGLPVTV